MEKWIAPNNLGENKSDLRKALEEDLLSLIEREVAVWHLDNVEPHYFFKGAVLCFIVCLPFWILLFNLIT